MIRVVIMAQGQQSRLSDLKIPKQLLPLALCNTTILDRTLSLLAHYDEVGEIVVVAGEEIRRHLAGPGHKVEHFETAGWRTCNDDGAIAAADAVMAWPARALRRSLVVEVVSLDLPGNSVIRGLRAIRPYLKREAVVVGGAGVPDRELVFDRTVILLGDVVYSRRCLGALVPKVAPAPIWFAVSPDLSPSGGEVYGCSYDVAGTAEFLSLLDEVVHPPFVDTYQPGQLRRLLWERQRRVLEAEMTERGVSPKIAALVRAGAPVPLESCCSIMDGGDYTRDIDTVEDMKRLGELDVAAWKEGL